MLTSAPRLRLAPTWSVLALLACVSHATCARNDPRSTLPERLTNEQFWDLSTQLSEPAGALAFQSFEAFHFFLFVFDDDFQVKERARRLGVDAVEHVLEHIERLLFVLDERIFLSVADEPDALFYLIDR